nr:hypothetical protein [Tanacetum cinerariifolium]
MDACVALTRRVEHLEFNKVAQALKITKLKRRVKKLERKNKVRVLKLRRLQRVGTSLTAETSDETVMDDVSEDAKVDENVDIHGRQAESQAKIYKIDFDQANKVLSIQEDETEPAEVQEVVDVVTTAKLITEVVTAASETVTATIIRDPESESTTSTIIPAKTKSKDKVIDHMKIKAKEDPAMKKYQALKRKPKTEAQARKNMMLYLKNVAGFKMDYFKGMSYDDIRPIFEAKFNSNVAFLLKTKEQIEEDENRALQRLNETPTEREAKRQKLDEEVEELKRHLQIVPNKDDDVYTEATPLARKQDIHAQIWKTLRNEHGPAKVKGWKLLESCGVQIITFTSTQLILLVDRKYPLTRFTLDQLLNAIRLKVEEESEVSLELLSSGSGNKEVEKEGEETREGEQGDDTAACGEVPTVSQEPSIPYPTPPNPPPQPPQDLPSTSQGDDAEEHCQDVSNGDAAQGDDTTAQRDDAQEPSIPSRTPHTPPPQPPQDLPSTSQKENRVRVLKLRRLKRVKTSQMIDTSEDTVMDDASNQGRIIDEMDNDDDVALMDDKKEEEAKVVEDDQEDKPAEVQEVVDVVSTAKLITEVVTASSETVTAASTIISGAEPQVPAAIITVAPEKVNAAPSRRRKGVVMRDPEEESTTSSIIPAYTKSKYNGKGILVEEPKPLKKKQQVEMDEEYARKLHAEINKDIDWDVAIDHTKERMEEEKSRALQTINETPAQKAAKRRKLSEEVEDLKRHLEIMPDEEDDVYTEATPLARMKPDGQDQVWKNQRTIHGQAKVKSWKLLESCGVHIITFSTTQLILLVERRYPLLRFTLDQMTNAVRLRVEEESEMSLDLLSYGVDAVMDLEEKHQVFNAAGEELSAAKQKMMLLDSAAEGTLMLLSQLRLLMKSAAAETRELGPDNHKHITHSYHHKYKKLVKMVPHEAFTCRCGKGDVVLRQSYKPESCASETLWMWIFLWKETRLCELMSSPRAPSTPSYSAGPSTPLRNSLGPSTPSSYSSGPSTPTNYSLGSSRNAECSNCKHLREKISVLKATMDMHMHPEQHIFNSAALLHEVLNEKEKLDLE